MMHLNFILFFSIYRVSGIAQDTVLFQYVFLNHQQYFLLLFGLDFLEQKFKKRERELGNLETTVTEYLQNNPILEKKRPH